MYGEEKQITVKQLINLLSMIADQDLPVEVEGCDCDGDAVGIWIDNRSCLIARNVNPTPYRWGIELEYPS